MDGVGGLCKSIVHLNINSTSVTTVGVRLALEHLPKLQILQCDSNLEAVVQMSRKREMEAAASSYQATDATARCFPLTNLDCYSSEIFSFVRPRGGQLCDNKYFPFVVDVTIMSTENSELLDQDLQSLLHLDRLRSLRLVRLMKVSFDGGLLPILQKFGLDSLEELNLWMMAEVDVAAIAKHCLKLRSLTLNTIHRYIPSTCAKSLRQFNNLVHLNIYQPQPYESPSSNDLATLLSSSSLASITMFGKLENLTDQVIERMVLFHQHGFPYLNSLKLSRCTNVTGRSIDLLLNSSTPITKIDITYCDNVSEEDVNKWRKMAKDNNWDLFIQFWKFTFA